MWQDGVHSFDSDECLCAPGEYTPISNISYPELEVPACEYQHPLKYVYLIYSSFQFLNALFFFKVNLAK